MLEIIQQCEQVLNELSKFSTEICFLGDPITDDRLKTFEKSIKLILPEDFKYIYQKHNRIVLNGTEIYGLDANLKGCSLDIVCQFEHFVVANPMPLDFIPFSPDGRGNHYCLNLLKMNDGVCPVVFWQHDFYYEGIDEVEECNPSFTDWINDVLIGWTLADCNYDGSEK